MSQKGIEEIQNYLHDKKIKDFISQDEKEKSRSCNHKIMYPSIISSLP